MRDRACAISHSLLTAIVVVARTAALDAQVVFLNPIADAFVASSVPDGNFGGGGSLGTAAGALPKGEFNTLLKFNLSPVKVNFDAAYGVGLWMIISMNLQLTASKPTNPFFNGNGAGPGGADVNFAGRFFITWMENNSWVEGLGTPDSPGTTGITFATLPSFLGENDETQGPFAFDGSITASVTYELTLTPSFFTNATEGNTVSLLIQPADDNVAMLVASRTMRLGGFPVLRVTALPISLPEPSGLHCALSGIVVLAAGRRIFRAHA